MNFTGNKWWEHKNPAYREACFRQSTRELIQSKKEYDYLIKINYEKIKMSVNDKRAKEIN